MTYKDLCTEITLLGFETELESKERVLSAVNRALMTIFTERPLYKKLTLYKHRMNPIQKSAIINHVGGNDITVKYNGAKAYSFKTCGVGVCVIEENGVSTTLEFSQNAEVHRGFLHGDGVIRFTGEYSYTIYDVAVFSEIFSEKAEEIPTLSDCFEYEMNKYCTDFLSFVSEPTDEYGMAIEGAVLQGNVISVPEDYSGKINLTYKSAPKKLMGNPDEQIPLPLGCEHLPALLASAYVWLDDDAEKAQYYMSLYREAISAVKYYGREKIDGKYRDVNGWT